MQHAASDAEWQQINADYVAEHGPSPRAAVADVADHIDHIGAVAGVDHVGIGADFYGARTEVELVQGLEDVSMYPALFAELARRGWSDDNLRKLARNNLLRAFSDVERTSVRLRRQEPPSTVTFQAQDQDAGQAE